MRVVGLSDRCPVAMADVGQGLDPMEALLSQGWTARRPLLAKRGTDGELELVVEVAPSRGGSVTAREPGRDADLSVGRGEQPTVKQRIAAYAVVSSGLGILATEYSDKTAAQGRWGLPGGGIDPDEEPTDAVVREVIEETSQHAQVHQLVDVHSAHWIGRSPQGVLENYHAIRLIYRAECARPTEPVVIDVGGTTSAARWVPLDSWSHLPWTHGWYALLSRVIGRTRS